jgi:small subunit ribosomal protein S13
MPRIAGVDIPADKRTEIALTYIFGIGRSNVQQILKEAAVDPDKRAKNLTNEEVTQLQRVLDRFNIEGELRQQIRENIERLKKISTYRGLRHTLGLPARGQRTRSNARTKRGKRRTVGALKKKDRQKRETTKKTRGKEEPEAK